MKLKQAMLGITLISTSLLSTAPSAATINLFASKDTTIYSNGRVNGTGGGLFAGSSGSGIDQRGLIAFDLSAITAGSIINSVTLTMHLNAQGSLAATETITLNMLSEDWNEAANGSGNANNGGGGGVNAVAGDATWTDSGFGAWTAGGNFNTTVSASQSVSGIGFYNWSSTGLISDVQTWVDNGGNFGWILSGNEIDAGSSKRFSSSENTGDSGTRVPVLSIEYSAAVVPVPAAVWLFGSGLIGLIGVARSKKQS